MYEIIKSIIDHSWVAGTTSTGDQQYIYYICGAVIVVLLVVFVDVIRGIFHGIFRG